MFYVKGPELGLQRFNSKAPSNLGKEKPTEGNIQGLSNQTGFHRRGMGLGAPEIRLFLGIIES